MAEDRQWDDINEFVKEEWKADSTPFERVYTILEDMREGSSAAEIAERALVSEPTARRHLKSLERTGFASTEQDGRTTLYKRDEDQIVMRRIHELRDEVTREELIEGIKDMKREIHEFEMEYDAVSPEELARQLSSEDAEAWDDVSLWKTTRQNLAIAQATLAYNEAREQLTA